MPLPENDPPGSRLAAAVGHAALVLFEIDAEGVITLWTGGSTGLTGMRPEDIIGKSFRDIFAAEQGSLKNAERALAGESFTSIATFGPTNTTWETRWSAKFDQAGSPAGTVGVSTETTRRVLAEAALKRSEKQLARAHEMSQMGSWEMDLKTNEFLWSAQVFKLYGLDSETDPPGLDSIFRVTHPADLPYFQRALRKTLETHSPLRASRRVLLPDGRTRVIETIAEVELDADGMPIKLFGSSQDVTDRNRMQLELQRSRAMLSEAMVLGKMASWEWDATSGAMVWSECYENVFGPLPAEREIREVFTRLIHPDDREAAFAIMAAATAAMRPFSLDYRIVWPDGRVVDVHTVGEPLVVGDGEARHVIGVSQDVTIARQRERELQQAYDEVRRLSDLKDEFISTVSHEFRTPLSVIKNAVSILSKPGAGTLNAIQHRYVAMVRRYTDSLARMVDDILDLQHVQAGAVQVELNPGDVALVLREAAEAIKPTAGERGLALVLDVSREPLPALIDRDRLNQVVLNLLVNATKFTPAGGTVTLRGYRKAGRIEVAVQDTGIGISKQDQARIFERFVQVDSANTRAAEGSGLGLAISKALVEDVLNGELRLESEPGGGSTFFISLQAESPQALKP